MNRVINWLKQYDTPVSTRGFAVFRITLSLFLLVLISSIYYYRPIIFNTIPHIAPNPFPAKLFLSMWAMVVLGLMIGWQTRVVAVINYLFVVITAFSFSNSGCGSFNDDLLRIGSFLLIIMPAKQSYSVDNVLHTIKYGQRQSNYTSYWNYLAALFVSLGLMYWASSLTKIYSPMWNKGLGLWIPSVMPHNKWHSVTFYLNWQWAHVAANYITIVWEFGLIFALFFKKIRTYAAWIGVFFHLVIASIFPFPLLCFGPIPFYMLFVNNTFWDRFKLQHIQVTINPDLQKHQSLGRLILGLNGNTILLHHNQNNIKINETDYNNGWLAARAALQSSWIGKCIAFFSRFELIRLFIDFVLEEVIKLQTPEQTPQPILSEKLRYGLLGIFCFGLLAVQTFYSSYHFYSRIKGGVTVVELKKFYAVRKDISDYSLKPSNLFRTLFGLNARGVFLDHSLSGSKTVFAVVRKQANGDTLWLPFFNPTGYCMGMNMNLAWSKYTFNSVCSGTIPNPKELEKVLWFWATKSNVKTDSLDFAVLKRTYHFPSTFQENYHQQLTNQPWILEGNVTWRKGKYNYTPLDSL
jgi:uncharacterized membrane protein YphA (DoxX/SURF4 family)